MPGTDRLAQELPGGKQTDTVEDDGEEDYAYHIEHKVHNSGAAGVPGGADGTHHSGDAGADVLTQNDGDGRTVGNGAGDTQTL